MSALFHGYLGSTGGGEGVEELLNGLDQLLHTSPSINTPVSDPLNTRLLHHIKEDSNSKSLDDNCTHTVLPSCDNVMVTVDTPPSGDLDNDASGCTVNGCSLESEQHTIQWQLAQEQLKREVS